MKWLWLKAVSWWGELYKPRCRANKEHLFGTERSVRLVHRITSRLWPENRFIKQSCQSVNLFLRKIICPDSGYIVQTYQSQRAGLSSSPTGRWLGSLESLLAAVHWEYFAIPNPIQNTWTFINRSFPLGKCSPRSSELFIHCYLTKIIAGNKG